VRATDEAGEKDERSDRRGALHDAIMVDQCGAADVIGLRAGGKVT